MAQRKTPNEQEWLNKLYQLQSRMRRMQNEGIDTSDIKIPTRPQTFTRKQIKTIDEVNEQLNIRQEEEYAKRIRAKRQQYDEGLKTYNRAKKQYRPKVRQHKGNPNGNPQNLVHKGNPQNLQHKGRPKGSKNKNPMQRKQSIKTTTPNANNIAMSDEVMYDNFMKRVSASINNGVDNGIYDFIVNMIEAYGEFGMLSLVNKMEQEYGIVLTDEILFDSDGALARQYINDFVGHLDPEESDMLTPFLRNIEEEPLTQAEAESWFED